jgi:uncharacterized Zn-binding protein involved in type VI secretion
MKVTINPPKTPVTKGSSGIAAATVPNVCKMPGPPAPFVPTPLPNIGKSGDSPQGYSTTVKIEGKPVAIRGASFGSVGDVASQGTGGGIVSSTTQGRTKFIGLGSMNVKIEGKNVQLLGDPMLNNCAGSGSPANAATMTGVSQDAGSPAFWELPIDCDEKRTDPRWREDPCKFEELCAMVKGYNESPHPKRTIKPSPSMNPNKASPELRQSQGKAFKAYKSGLDEFDISFTKLVADHGKDAPEVVACFHCKCRHEQWSKAGGKTPMQPRGVPDGVSPDHVHPVGLGGPPEGPHKWASALVNQTVGPSMDKHDPEKHPAGIKAKGNCNCDA